MSSITAILHQEMARRMRENPKIAAPAEPPTHPLRHRLAAGAALAAQVLLERGATGLTPSGLMALFRQI
jgi:hypothetical protein